MYHEAASGDLWTSGRYCTDAAGHAPATGCGAYFGTNCQTRECQCDEAYPTCRYEPEGAFASSQLVDLVTCAMASALPSILAITSAHVPSDTLAIAAAHTLTPTIHHTGIFTQPGWWCVNEGGSSPTSGCGGHTGEHCLSSYKTLCQQCLHNVDWVDFGGYFGYLPAQAWCGSEQGCVRMPDTGFLCQTPVQDESECPPSGRRLETPTWQAAHPIAMPQIALKESASEATRATHRPSPSILRGIKGTHPSRSLAETVKGPIADAASDRCDVQYKVERAPNRSNPKALHAYKPFHAPMSNDSRIACGVSCAGRG